MNHEITEMSHDDLDLEAAVESERQMYDAAPYPDCKSESVWAAESDVAKFVASTNPP